MESRHYLRLGYWNPSGSGHLLQHLAKRLIQPIDLGLLDNERRGQRHDIRRHTDQHSGLEGLNEGFVGAPARRPGTGLELDRRHQAAIADVDHVPVSYTHLTLPTSDLV